MFETASAKASGTSTSPRASKSTAREQPKSGGSRPALVRVAFPAPAPASAAPTTSLAGVALLTLDRPEVLNALDFDLLDELAAALEAMRGFYRSTESVAQARAAAFGRRIDTISEVSP